MTDDLYGPQCRVDIRDYLSHGLPVLPETNPFLGLGESLIDMGVAAVKAKLQAVTLQMALDEFNRLFPRPSRFYRKRRTRSMRGK